MAADNYPSVFSKKYANNYTIDILDKIFHKEKFQRNITLEDEIIIAKVLNENYNQILNNNDYVNKISRRCNYKYMKEHIIKAYRILLRKNLIKRDVELERIMVRKAPRGHSGVEVVTIFTSPVQFGDSSEASIKRGGCPKNCHYCPFERDDNGVPTQPRSYLSTEPGNMRASQNLHHPVGQMFDRIYTLEEIGHIPDIPTSPSKLEIIISGGTFNFYPKEYIEWFTACMYYAANVYYDYRTNNILPRDVLSLEEEITINSTASLRVIGLTIETRPDYLDPRDYNLKLKDIPNDDIRVYEVLHFFRKLGVTRVQIGVQHTDDNVLAYVNRECTNDQNIKAIKFLKQNGFKVDIHLMLDLPSSTPDLDIHMLNEVLTNPDYEADQWKIYPTEVTNFSKIKEWYDAGEYKPYAELNNGSFLENVIIFAKERMKPWIRINRVIRDIPSISIEGGIDCPDMRQQIESKMKIKGIYCKCIRCREVKLKKVKEEDIELKIRNYEGSSGDEYFISYETKDEKTLLGYIRLRLNNHFTDTMPELQNCAFIRELHVLGKHTEVGSKTEFNTQHKGYGKLLVAKAEEIAIQKGFKKMSVISGVGVREYYKKFGYQLENTFMMKELNKPNNINPTIQTIIIIIIHIIFVFLCWLINKIFF